MPKVMSVWGPAGLKNSLTSGNAKPLNLRSGVPQAVGCNGQKFWQLLQIGLETSFSAKIPLIGGADTTIWASTEFTKGGSKSSTNSQTFEATFPIKCPPNTTLKATASIRKGKVEVPYTATIRRIVIGGTEEEFKYEVKGVYHGVNAFDLTNVIVPLE